MTTTDTIPTAADPAAAAASRDDDGLSHVVRDCDSDTALCGTPVADHPWIEDSSTDEPCEECAAIDDEGDTAHMAVCSFCQFVEAAW